MDRDIKARQEESYTSKCDALGVVGSYCPSTMNKSY